MSQPSTAPGAIRSCPPRRPTRSQTCQPSCVWGRSPRRPRSICHPRRRTSRQGRGDVFFRVQQQAARDILRLERLEDRPDFEEGVDALRRNGDDVARIIADTLPIQYRAPRYGFGHGQCHFLLGRTFGERFHNQIGAGRDHQRGGQRADQQAQAGGEVQPFGRGGQVQSDHDQYPARVLMRTAVHMRAGLVAFAACQSKLACTPWGPAISMRGIGR